MGRPRIERGAKQDDVIRDRVAAVAARAARPTTLLGQKTDRSVTVPLDRLHPDPRNNEVFELGGIEDLARDIEANGLAHYPVVRPHPEFEDEYMIVAGHRRHAALSLLVEQGHGARFGQVACHLVPSDDLDSGVLMLTTNVRQRDLSTLERIHTITFAQTLVAELREAGRLEAGTTTDGKIAELVNLAPRTVAYYRSLTKLIEGLRALLDERRITFTTARELAQQPVDVQERVLAQIEAGEDGALSGAQVAALTQSATEKEPSAPKVPDAGILVSALERATSKLLRFDAAAPDELEPFIGRIAAAVERLDAITAKRGV
ncbi:MAG: ParB/RepB/Spo0J family partition protein [Coriobacteriia bacterium]|nr:ParB/RepB/Spo0J family partition protein [Coriobacteriia bacterium]